MRSGSNRTSREIVEQVTTNGAPFGRTPFSIAKEIVR